MNLSIFQEILTPFLTVSLISTKINLFVHWYFQRQFGFCWRQSQKKSIFPPRNHYFGDFHIDHHPMHYSITKKHALSLHVKNIDIKNYAINSATAVVYTSREFCNIQNVFTPKRTTSKDKAVCTTSWGIRHLQFNLFKISRFLIRLLQSSRESDDIDMQNISGTFWKIY